MIRHMLTALAAALPCKPAREPSFAYRPQPKVAPVVCDCNTLAIVAWNTAIELAQRRPGYVNAIGRA